jgi:multicomponent Na+:H+ antiporter subunit D
MFTQAALGIESWIAVAAIMGVSMLTLFSMTKIWGEAYLKQPKGEEPATTQTRFFRQNKTIMASVLLLTVLILGLGFFPGPVIGWCRAAADQLLNKQQYIEAVLGR